MEVFILKIDTNRLIEDKKYCEDVFNYFLRVKTIKETHTAFFVKHINKAISNLEFANFILDEHNHSIKKTFSNKTFYDWCITIYYYSLYHAVLALVVKLEYESKNHLATISAVALFYYHKDNILDKKDIQFIIEHIDIDKEEISMLLDSKSIRERACYGVDESFQLYQAKNMQEKTADFVNKAKILLKE